jgi:hypothetical protein
MRWQIQKICLRFYSKATKQSVPIATVRLERSPQAGSFTECLHLLCGNCMAGYRQDCENNKEDNAQCPICGLHFKHTQPMAKPWPNAETKNLGAAVEGHSSKLTALIRDIEEHRYRAKRMQIFFSFLSFFYPSIYTVVANKKLQTASSFRSGRSHYISSHLFLKISDYRSLSSMVQ